jgi:hypothetical protein
MKSYLIDWELNYDPKELKNGVDLSSNKRSRCCKYERVDFVI